MEIQLPTWQLHLEVYRHLKLKEKKDKIDELEKNKKIICSVLA